jgi:hypothetical protein
MYFYHLYICTVVVLLNVDEYNDECDGEYDDEFDDESMMRV